MMRNFVFLISLTFLSLSTDGFVLTNDIDNNPSSGSLVLRDNEELVQSFEDDPDVDLRTLEMIERAGYPAEAHVVTTSDGYILELHRIPGGPGSVPVFLQHGLLSSSADWVVTGKGKGLAYLLADKGYDVWLGNARGNTYSRAHTTLSTSDSKFWDFSWDEMGLYDLPAVITYITNYKSDTLIYIGHSMGTTMFYVMASKRPDIADKVRAMMSLAPVAYVSHVKSPVRIVAPFAHNIEGFDKTMEYKNGQLRRCETDMGARKIASMALAAERERHAENVFHIILSGMQQIIAHFLGADEFLPQNVFLKFLSKYGCEIDTIEEEICSNVVFVICGFDKDQFNKTLMPVILSHAPAGTSTKTLVHYAQEIISGHFQAYDYGSSRNRQYYNSSAPPDYDLSKVRVPVALFVADNDWLAASRDVNYLWQQLPKKIIKYRVNYPKFNHVDFLYAVDVPKLVYNPLLSVMEAYRDGKPKAKLSV